MSSPIHRYVGIDPDSHGALVYIDVIDGEPGVPVLWDCPTFLKKEGSQALLIDIVGVGALVRRVADGDPLYSESDLSIDPPDVVTAVLEEVQAMPSHMGGGFANFARGRYSAAWEAALATANVPYQTVRPSAWKKYVGLKAGAEKADSLLMARRLFPALAGYLTRKKDHGRAEAVLLAHYCYKINR